jgi:catechol-2,3-dioxygenase
MSDAQVQEQAAEGQRPQLEKSADPVLKLNFLSHGTLESRDLDRAREFYTEFLGLEVIRTSPISLLIRLGGPNTIAVVHQKNKSDAMSLLNHNGLDVETEAEVNAAYEKVLENAEKYSLTKISKPIVQHGTYSFYFWDMDDNCWEILTNPKGGYSWLFERGDQKGKGHMDRNFDRPTG